MRKLMMVASLVLSMAACGSKGGMDGALDKMEDFKTQMCKCADKACADKVSKDMETWSESQDKAMKDAKPTKAQEERAGKLMGEMMECAMKHQKTE